ncbi:DsbA family protein [Tropicimonas isoalkanivorans]|uniref:Protein-disulfide isomerase n=1 Tax=Tropicimonas isoalkanivorans TaxID=441112 RepID=A0A1I1E9L6_9RHOB|nr:DsbA family protein [Tropicimonas isoalkanivorans]SFB81700.1 Protein-disulfide isomerase [Tropicimonas isoalkanivorans]
MKTLPLAAALAFGVALPAAALDMTNLTDSEREAFRAEVRTYLLENPEVLMEAISVLEQRNQEAQADNDVALVQANAADLFDVETDWVGGNPEGDVTIVEFVDYRCGYCRKAYPEVNQLIEDDGEIRLILKEFPILGEQSVLSTRVALATRNAFGDDAYGRMHDALITLRGEVNDESIRSLAADLDLDGDKILAGMSAPEVDAVIAENHALAQRLQISGTPTFVVGDQLLRGYLPYDGMKHVVEQVREADG